MRASSGIPVRPRSRSSILLELGRRPAPLLAQLALDGLELLAQEVLALRLAHLLVRLLGQLLAHLPHGQLVLQQVHQRAQPLLHRGGLEELLALPGRQRRGGGDLVGDLPGLGQAVDGRGDLVGQVGDERHQPGEQVARRARERLDLQAADLRLGDHLDSGHEVGLGLHGLADANTDEPLRQDAQRAVRRMEDLVDERDGAHRVQLVEARGGRVPAALGDGADEVAAAHRLLDQAHAALLAHRQRRDGHREDDGLAQGQHRQGVWDGGQRLLLRLGPAAPLRGWLGHGSRPPLSASTLRTAPAPAQRTDAEEKVRPAGPVGQAPAGRRFGSPPARRQIC
ncbi:MAG: hypothetical protein QM765_44360 [Myxococcales bacterium]